MFLTMNLYSQIDTNLYVKNQILVKKHNSLGILMGTKYNNLTVGNNEIIRFNLSREYNYKLVIQAENIICLYNGVEIYCYNNEFLTLDVKSNTPTNELIIEILVSYKETRNINGNYNYALFRE